MTLIANGDIPPTGITITNDGFFPDINTNRVRDTMRLDSAISDARLEQATMGAMFSVNMELKSYALEQQSNGYSNLNAVPDVNIGGTSRPVWLYQRAVFSTAAAELTEHYRSYDSSGDGLDTAELLSYSIDEYRRDARWAIRDLLGQSRSTVDLL
ncbi:head completion/stabilization protein [Celerinatantimonas sp. MCCC 1A17872]|uniref:head completion/stabilization protein n=1 Tax=Celerinatantimonas sp. MCCC 1A17872 TaxID=3177514 RepID=UPI0038C04F05